MKDLWPFAAFKKQHSLSYCGQSDSEGATDNKSPEMKFAAFALAAVLMTASSQARPIHSGEGQPDLLRCSVHADPMANVTWYKNAHSGKPERPEVDPVLQGVPMPGGSTAWRISWATRSYANVTEYRLLYRKIPVRDYHHRVTHLDGINLLLT